MVRIGSIMAALCLVFGVSAQGAEQKKGLDKDYKLVGSADETIDDGKTGSGTGTSIYQELGSAVSGGSGDARSGLGFSVPFGEGYSANFTINMGSQENNLYLTIADDSGKVVSETSSHLSLDGSDNASVLVPITVPQGSGSLKVSWSVVSR